MTVTIIFILVAAELFLCEMVRGRHLGSRFPPPLAQLAVV